MFWLCDHLGSSQPFAEDGGELLLLDIAGKGNATAAKWETTFDFLLVGLEI